MSWLAWIIVALITIALVWLTLSLTVFAVPEADQGKVFMVIALKGRHVPIEHLPPEFFADCVVLAEKTNPWTPDQSAVKRKANVLEDLDRLASDVQLWRAEPGNPKFKHNDDLRSLLEKYDLRHGL